MIGTRFRTWDVHAKLQDAKFQRVDIVTLISYDLRPLKRRCSVCRDCLDDSGIILAKLSLNNFERHFEVIL